MATSSVGVAGGKSRHNRIATNLVGLLFAALRGKRCSPWSSDQRVRNDSRKLYAYPDVSVVCGPPVFAEEDEDTITNAKVIFEVLSKSTEEIDRGIKFIGYRAMPSLSQYVLVSQTRPRVEIFTRDGDGEWRPDGVVTSGVVSLSSIDVDLSIEEIYENVEGLPVGG
jgi:Uma2 family endonuclease